MPKIVNKPANNSISVVGSETAVALPVREMLDIFTPFPVVDNKMLEMPLVFISRSLTLNNKLSSEKIDNVVW